MTDTSKNLDRAITLAREARRLRTAGRIPEARQAERTIGDLVGYRTPSGQWRLPREVRDELAEK